jgi:hypothetical protein
MSFHSLLRLAMKWPASLFPSYRIPYCNDDWYRSGTRMIPYHTAVRRKKPKGNSQLNKSPSQSTSQNLPSLSPIQSASLAPIRATTATIIGEVGHIVIAVLALTSTTGVSESSRVIAVFLNILMRSPKLFCTRNAILGALPIHYLFGTCEQVAFRHLWAGAGLPSLAT